MNHITILRHQLATLGYRTGYALSNIENNYPEFEAGNGVKSPHDILHHMIHLCKGPFDYLRGEKFTPTEKVNWDDSIRLFYHYLKVTDEILKSIENPDEKMLLLLFQGPMCDAMTHVGQLMTLRRFSGDPLKGLHFMKVDIQTGKLDYTEDFTK